MWWEEGPVGGLLFNSFQINVKIMFDRILLGRQSV